MSWPEIRTAIDAQLLALRRAYAGWLARRDRLAATRNRAHHVLAGGTSAPPREALAHIHAAYGIGAETGPLLAAAVKAIESYLKAVDPDNAAGSVSDLPRAHPVGPPHGGHQEPAGPPVPAARRPLHNGWRRRSHVFTEQGPAGLADLLARGTGLLARHAAWLRAGGHTLDRHGGSVTDAQLTARVRHHIDPMTGTTFDWERGESRHRCGRYATAFGTDEAASFAEMRVHDHPANSAALAEVARADAAGQPQNRYQVEVAAKDVFGDDFRQHLRGWSRIGSRTGPGDPVRTVFTADSTIVVRYERPDPSGQWRAITCFPNP